MMKYQESVVILFDYKNKDILNVNEQFYKYFDKSVEENFQEKYNCICDIFIESKGFLSATNHPNWLDVVEKDTNTNYKAKILDKNDEEQFIITLTDITYLENIIKTKKIIISKYDT